MRSRVEVRPGDHYIVAHANVKDGRYTLSGYYVDGPIDFEVETNENGGVTITKRGASATASYDRFSNQPLFKRRFGHLFVIESDEPSDR